MKKENIAIFGYMDTFTGQIINMLDKHTVKNIKFIISVKKIPKINISKEHSQRPNNKTEFIVKNKIFSKKVYYKKNYINFLKKNNIKYCYILEDDKYLRESIFLNLKKNKFNISTFIHKSSILIGKNKIGEGSIIYPNCYIGYKTDIGNCVVIQSNSAIEHHNVIKSFVDINPGVITGGFSKIEKRTTIHLGTKIINKITIGKDIIVGAGSLVLKNLSKKGLYFGSPAKFIK